MEHQLDWKRLSWFYHCGAFVMIYKKMEAEEYRYETFGTKGESYFSETPLPSEKAAKRAAKKFIDEKLSDGWPLQAPGW